MYSVFILFFFTLNATFLIWIVLLLSFQYILTLFRVRTSYLDLFIFPVFITCYHKDVFPSKIANKLFVVSALLNILQWYLLLVKCHGLLIPTRSRNFVFWPEVSYKRRYLIPFGDKSKISSWESGWKQLLSLGQNHGGNKRNRAFHRPVESCCAETFVLEPSIAWVLRKYTGIPYL